MTNFSSSDREKFLEFQELWNVDRVRNMSLEDYTGIGGGANRDDFTYWLEAKLDCLGSIWGIGSYKFGIYQYNNKPSKPCYDDKYAWSPKYGQDSKEAFHNVKSKILKIIEYSQSNALNKIDDVDLGHVYKWKIAFHYQNADDIKIVCIFNGKVLQAIASDEGFGNKLSTSQIYERLLGGKKYTLEEMMNQISRPLWPRYEYTK
ncbi:MAG: hypothetical protein K2N12_06800 [Helicobacter sp.]|nr:hypothetical protein [Helicobacter sp.]